MIVAVMRTGSGKERLLDGLEGSPEAGDDFALGLDDVIEGVGSPLVIDHLPPCREVVHRRQLLGQALTDHLGNLQGIVKGVVMMVGVVGRDDSAHG